MKKIAIVSLFLLFSLESAICQINLSLPNEITGIKMCRYGTAKEKNKAMRNGEFQILSFFRKDLMKHISTTYQEIDTGYYHIWAREVFNAKTESNTYGFLSGLIYNKCNKDPKDKEIFICEVCLDKEQFINSQNEIARDIDHYISLAKSEYQPGIKLIRYTYALAKAIRLLLPAEIKGQPILSFINDGIENIANSIDVSLNIEKDKYSNSIVINFTSNHIPVTNIPFNISPLGVDNYMPDKNGNIIVSSKNLKTSIKQLKVCIAWDHINYPFSISESEKKELKSILDSFNLFSKTITIPVEIVKPSVFIDGKWQLGGQIYPIYADDFESVLLSEGYNLADSRNNATLCLHFVIKTHFSSQIRGLYFYKSTGTVYETVNGGKNRMWSFSNNEECKRGGTDKNKTAEESKRCVEEMIKQVIVNKY